VEIMMLTAARPQDFQLSWNTRIQMNSAVNPTTAPTKDRFTPGARGRITESSIQRACAFGAVVGMGGSGSLTSCQLLVPLLHLRLPEDLAPEVPHVDGPEPGQPKAAPDEHAPREEHMLGLVVRLGDQGAHHPDARTRNRSPVTDVEETSHLEGRRPCES
jgi:hypothetical protein